MKYYKTRNNKKINHFRANHQPSQIPQRSVENITKKNINIKIVLPRKKRRKNKYYFESKNKIKYRTNLQ